MNDRRNRQLCAVVGTGLALVGGGSVAVFGGDLLDTPVLFGQMTLLGLAGVSDIVAATDTRLTDRWAWYRWSGAGYVMLGLSLPLGYVGTVDELFFPVITAGGGLTLAAMGVDMIAFHGKYTRGTRLDHTSG